MSQPVPDFPAPSKRPLRHVVIPLAVLGIAATMFGFGNDLLRSIQRTIERTAHAAVAQGQTFDYLYRDR
jgi:hypothetical protein